MADASIDARRARLPEAVRSVWTLSALVVLAVALLDPARLGEVLGIAAGSFAGTLPYIALAVVTIAWLRAAGAEAAIGRAFEGREARAVVLAALLGGLAPFCSCEVVPFIAGLLAVGAPLSAIMAFWLASPLVDPPTLLITAAALGWPFALGKAVSAVGIGLLGGAVTAAILRTGGLSDTARPDGPAARRSCCGTPSCGGIGTGRPVWRIWAAPERRATFATEALANARFLVKWLAFAYLLQALLVLYLPADLVAGLAGGEGPASIGVAALVGMPAYLNGYVAPPLLAGLMAQGMSAGAAMAFLVAGAVSCIPAMAAIWSLVRARVFALYIACGFVGAVLAGGVFGLVA